MHKFLTWTILCFFFTCTAVKAGDIYINCGSTGTSTALDGREWLGDIYPIDFEIRGSSTKSSSVTLPHVGPVPYRTARISSYQFSYIFQVSPGQKFIRLHFNPTSSYKGFKRFSDLFTVEAGPFTLLSNFSASITADALSLNHFTKEYCLSVEENQPLNITFSSQAQDRHAFINGIEIISVPESISYCQSTGNVGVQVIGQKSLVYIENSIALEMVHRQIVKQDFISSGDDFRDMFGIWATVAKEKANRVKNITWRVSVDVGFRYLVRLHFCEPGLEIAENGKNNFVLLIDHMVVNINSGIFEKVNDEGGGFYRNYVVMAKGRKQEGKRDILIFLQSEDEFIYGSSPLEGFEIFKLSNPDNSLASPNPLPSKQDSPYRSIQNSLPFLGRKNTIATVGIVLLCMLNIFVHMLQKIWKACFPEEEENKPSIRTTRLCRCFSLAEMRLATKDFNDALFIGRGGFGKVYKGFIDNGQKIVAIKRLKSDSRQGKREFWAEIETLSELRHVNLVSLIGYCDELEEMILVYDYMPNGTLADHLYRLARKNQKYSSLSWEERLNICIGAGRGIDYLHTGNGVIHRDIKASNILLDETFVAKVSDFGLAKTLNLKELQSQVSTNFKGTFGYFDPEYFKTQKLTFKSDTYSFGVVLLEVLSGRPAVDPLVEEDKQSLTMWAQDKISRGEVDQIVARSLRGSISPYSLKAFVDIVERCLHNEPKKRPTLAHVVIHLEFVLEQQNTKSLVPSSSNSDKNLEENANFLVPNEITNVADILPCTELEEISESFVPNERASTDALQFSDKQILSARTGPLAMASSSNAQSFSSGMVNAEPPYGKKYGRKTIIHKISRLWKRDKPSMENNSLRMTMFSAPLSHNTSNKTPLRGSTIPRNGELPRVDGSNGLVLATPNIRIFSFFELKAATRNFRADTVVGEGGFGRVYKGFLKEISTNKNGKGSLIAIKRLNPDGMQGFREWLAEVNYLGRLSHPNLVKLLGYCYEDKELLIVYEFLAKGSLEKLLFAKNSGVQQLPWDIRLKILTGAAHGLAFLHALDVPVIYRDFKTSNMLLDDSYNVKLADFGLAKSGPMDGSSHVTTRVMGTMGYAAPEYVATGHLTTKSDVYSFGVILVEILTGLRALDRNRPSTQRNLVDWIKRQLSQRSKLTKIMDPRLEGGYNPKSASKVLQLARSCLENDPKARPSMQEVVEILETIDSSIEKLKETRVRFSNQVLVG